MEPEPVDHRQVEWSRVARATYLIRQMYRYDYPQPIEGLEHRLVIVPPDRFGDQRRLLHSVTATPQGELEMAEDGFGNTVVELRFPVVQSWIEFQAWIEVERGAGTAPHHVPAAWLDDRRLLEPSDLTAADAQIAEVSAWLAASGESGLGLAGLVNRWVFENLRYQWGITGVSTTAAQALALGRGVCQDFAHVMIAICRGLGLPVRYVSGHRLGEGGTHAWVEVLVPDPATPGIAVAWPFDPTSGRQAGLDYVTVAVGRDYRDVAPTSGTYSGGPSGRLTSRKRVEVTRLEYVPA